MSEMFFHFVSQKFIWNSFLFSKKLYSIRKPEFFHYIIKHLNCEIRTFYSENVSLMSEQGALGIFCLLSGALLINLKGFAMHIASLDFIHAQKGLIVQSMCNGLFHYSKTDILSDAIRKFYN